MDSNFGYNILKLLNVMNYNIWFQRSLVFSNVSCSKSAFSTFFRTSTNFCYKFLKVGKHFS